MSSVWRGHRLAVAGVVGLVVIALGAGGVALASSDGGGRASPPARPSSTSLASVVRRDLVDRESVDGTLGYGEETALSAPRSGTVTAAPAVGAVVERGQPIITIDEVAVPLMYGAEPLWRPLSEGVDDGADVRQLEENLIALGFATNASLTPDTTFTSATTAAVKRWQKADGFDQTGRIEVGAVVFAPGAVRVASRSATVGSQVGPGSPMMQVTGTARLVSVQLDAVRQALATVGAKVRVTLPDASTSAGTILEVGTVATRDADAGADAPATITVKISLDDPARAGTLDQAPVTVEFTKSTATDVTAVPVRALLALSEGGYALEVRTAAGTHLVPVKLGGFADGYVEVHGNVQPGDRVVATA
jgi:peptidoglycan hydrolase-like protein with peptidoglycan-binding domain